MARTKFKGVTGVDYANPGLSEEEDISGEELEVTKDTHEHYSGEFPGKGKTGGLADLHEHLRANGFRFDRYEGEKGQVGSSLVYVNDAGQEAHMELVTPADQTWVSEPATYNPRTGFTSTRSSMRRPSDEYVLKSYPDIGAGIGVINGQSVSPRITPGGQIAQIPNDGTAPSAGTAPLTPTYPYPESQWPRQDGNAGAVMPKLQAQGDPHVLYGVENKQDVAPNNSVTQPGMDRTVVGDKWQPQYQTRMYIDNGQDYMNAIPGHWDLLDRALGGRGFTRNILDDGIPPRSFINQSTWDTAEANVGQNNFIVVQFFDRTGALLDTVNTFSGLDGFLGQRFPYTGVPGESPSGDALYKPSTQNGVVRGQSKYENIPKEVTDTLKSFLAKHNYNPLTGEWVEHTQPAPSQMLGGSPGADLDEEGGPGSGRHRTRPDWMTAHQRTTVPSTTVPEATMPGTTVPGFGEEGGPGSGRHPEGHPLNRIGQTYRPAPEPTQPHVPGRIVELPGGYYTRTEDEGGPGSGRHRTRPDYWTSHQVTTVPGTGVPGTDMGGTSVPRFEEEKSRVYNPFSKKWEKKPSVSEK